MKIVLKLLHLLVAVPLIVLWRGYVGSILWGWFAVPLGAPVIGVVEFCGLSLTLVALRGTAPIPKELVSTAMSTAVGVLVPLILLAFGAVLHLWL